MRATVFLVFLVLLLSGGGHAVASPAVSAIVPFHVTHTKVVDIEQEQVLVKSIYLDTKTEYLVGDDLEDEEDNNDTIARKFRWLVRTSLTSSYLFTLSRCYNCHTLQKPLDSIPSDKYLVQRVLRI